MAQEVIGIDIQVNGSAAQKSVGSIRQEIKESQRALIAAQEQFGEYSAEAVAAAKKVAQLKDRVQEAAETAALFDPGAKFKAFSGAIQAVAGGFAAVQGALGLVGVESEDLQKQLLKVQSALALSEGLSRITDSAKDFRRLGAVIEQTAVFQKGLAAANLATAAATRVLGVSATTTSVGFKVLRGAIIATGIGALAVGIIALVQNFDKLKAAVLNAVPGLKTIADGIGNLVNRVTDFLGITSEVERQTAKALEENTKAIRATEKELELNGDKYDDYTTRKIKANLDYRKNLEELLKDEKLTEDERTRYIKQAREKANREIAKADTDRQAAADKVAEDARKKAAEKAKQEADARAEATKQGNEELAKLREEATLAAIADETLRALKTIDIQVENDKKRIEASKLSTELKEQLITEITAKGERDRNAIREKAAQDAIANESVLITSIRDAIQRAGELRKEQQIKEAEDRIAQIEAEIEQTQNDFDRRRELLDIEQSTLDDALAKKLISEQEYTAKVKELSQERINTEQAERDAKIKLQSEYLGLVQGLSSLARTIFEKNKGVQIAGLIAEQGAAVAQIAVNTAAANAKAVSASPLTGGLPWTAINTISAGIGIASAIANTVKGIRQIQGATPSSTSAPGGVSIPQPAAGAASAPIRPEANAQVVGQTLNREAINRVGSAATRAYVVESDVSSAQERSRRLERAARLG